MDNRNEQTPGIPPEFAHAMRVNKLFQSRISELGPNAYLGADFLEKIATRMDHFQLKEASQVSSVFIPTEGWQGYEEEIDFSFEEGDADISSIDWKVLIRRGDKTILLGTIITTLFRNPNGNVSLYLSEDTYPTDEIKGKTIPEIKAERDMRIQHKLAIISSSPEADYKYGPVIKPDSRSEIVQEPMAVNKTLENFTHID